MYLSYSGYKTAYECLFQYWNGYINYTLTEKPDDRLGSIFGSVIGLLFEQFYNDRYWKHGPDCSKRLKELIPGLVEKVISSETTAKRNRPAGTLLWRSLANPQALYESPEEIIEDVSAHVYKGLATIKHDYLIGRDVKTEMKLDTFIEGHTIAGRADFVLNRTGHKDLVLLDGKGSRTGAKYLSSTQLYWYAMLHKETQGVLPDWLGFVLWRFSPPDSLVRFEVCQNDTDALKHKAVSMADNIVTLTLKAPKGTPVAEAAEVFTPNPNKENCRFCNFATSGVCPKGASVVAKML